MTLDEAIEIVIVAIGETSLSSLPQPVERAFRHGGGHDLRLGDIGIDSLGVTEICLAIEDKTGVAVPPSRLTDRTTIAELAALVVEG